MDSGRERLGTRANVYGSLRVAAYAVAFIEWRPADDDAPDLAADRDPANEVRFSGHSSLACTGINVSIRIGLDSITERMPRRLPKHTVDLTGQAFVRCNLVAIFVFSLRGACAFTAFVGFPDSG